MLSDADWARHQRMTRLSHRIGVLMEAAAIMRHLDEVEVSTKLSETARGYREEIASLHAEG